MTRRVKRGDTAPQLGIVGAGDDRAVERHLVGEVDEGLLQVGEAAVVLQVLAVDVGDHRNRRRQLQERAVALVGLRPPCTRRGRAARCCRRRSAGRRSPRSDRGRRARARARSSTSCVVLPCAPATAMPKRSRISSASISARGITGIAARAGLRHLGVVGLDRRRDTTTSASPTWPASWPTCTVTPSDSPADRSPPTPRVRAADARSRGWPAARRCRSCRCRRCRRSECARVLPSTSRVHLAQCRSDCTARRDPGRAERRAAAGRHAVARARASARQRRAPSAGQARAGQVALARAPPPRRAAAERLGVLPLVIVGRRSAAARESPAVPDAVSSASVVAPARHTTRSACFISRSMS